MGEFLRPRGGDTNEVKNKTITFYFFGSTADSERSDADV